MSTERTVEENRRSRPVLQTTKAIKSLLSGAADHGVQQDAARGIVWLRRRRDRRCSGRLTGAGGRRRNVATGTVGGPELEYSGAERCCNTCWRRCSRRCPPTYCLYKKYEDCQTSAVGCVAFIHGYDGEESNMWTMATVMHLDTLDSVTHFRAGKRWQSVALRANHKLAKFIHFHLPSTNGMAIYSEPLRQVSEVQVRLQRPPLIQ